ncbi:polysaccharide deacetylase family protein [Niallia endozanthoxylica]|uniref:Glycosyltransferase n=1 Tax=Niallia endozanthoxylica TaxID=2036016 RepID=A0A5J5H4J2_9BACI|nr:polysaccharide deacetylase family protein [Niallia endozanthoxylica]KAA9015511.1 glycosyltransferase [Niallia endozanthoxylica]
MKTNPKEPKKFIFFERSGRRWRYSKFSFNLILVVAIIFILFIAKGLFDRPQLAELDMNNSNIKPINNPVPHSDSSDGKELSFDSIAIPQQETKPKIFTFYQSQHYSNTENLVSLKKNIHSIDVLIPDWLYFNKDGSIVEKSEARIDYLVRESGVQIVPSITLDQNSTADDVHNWLSNPQTQDQMSQNLLNVIKTNGYQGVHLNFEDVHWEDKDLYNQFVTKLYHSFHNSGLLLTLFVRLGDDTYDTKLLSDVSDHLIVKAFDQHIEQGEPGPLASFQWTQDLISQYSGAKEKLVLCLANYGYDWNVTTGEPAAPHHFSTLMEMISRENLKVQWNDQFLSPYVRYKELGEEHLIWFLDAATFYNQWEIAQSHQIPSIGIWNIGSEDPTIWRLLSGKIANPLNLEKIPNRVAAAIEGTGDFLKVNKTETEGERKFELDHHLIKREIYEKYPTPYLLKQYGVDEKKVAISFDDGPNPKYTGKILEILNKHDVKAAFFLIGQNASMYPELTKRIYKEGHEIGSHTFTHTDVMSISDKTLEFELNSTQRVIQGITGHSVVMFRPPFLSLYEEHYDLPSKEVFNKILKVQELGYTVVSSSIDPKDWNGKSANEIYENTIENVHNGQIILLHDSGGDRTPTIEALPKIIRWLKANGYSIVPVSELVGLERSVVMPTVQETEKSMTPVYLYGSTFNAALIKSIKIFLFLLIVIGLFRLAMLLFFSLKQKRKSEHRVYENSYQPFVSILIAAYNEDKVIGKTIQSIMNSRYPQFELIIVDDGSTDQTANIVETECNKYSNMRLLKKANGGKASALNLGIQNASAEIIVTLDADTVIAEDTISMIIRHFIDSSVGAVAGNVKIGNRKNLLTWWQHIEYVTGFNLEKRAFDELDSITVVPGAIGAWRKSAMMEIGLFEEDTLAEDTDATMKLLRKGYKIRSEVKALAYTEAPEDIKSFIKQRYRWTFGILQCLWKHREALFDKKNKKLGFIAMPNMLFQYILLAAAPLADIILILALTSSHMFVAYFYLAFLLVDILISAYSFSLEKEKKKPLLTLFIQRVVYRQFFTYVVWKSFLFAIKGQLMGWNKLQRTGNVLQTELEEKQKKNASFGA